MKSSERILLCALRKEKTERPPFWFMRQAGRFLPEYRELRSRHRNFLEFCYTPEAATEATLQPIRRFGMDAAIIFSDILVVPHALGAGVRFEEGKGPLLTPLRSADDFKKLGKTGDEKILAPVYEALALTRKALSEETALIGFVGAPWTLACYMAEGGASKEFREVKGLMRHEEALFSDLVERLTEAALGHAVRQLEAGAEVIQLFDSWAGLLNEEEYRRWSIEPARTIVAGIKKAFPDAPVIGFPRQSGSKFEAYVEQTGVDAISIDQSVPLEWARDHLQTHAVVQGCLSNELLAGDRQAMLAEAAQIIEIFGHKPFVFNLGHGILPATPVENMQALCEFLKRTRQ